MAFLGNSQFLEDFGAVRVRFGFRQRTIERRALALPEVVLAIATEIFSLGFHAQSILHRLLRLRGKVTMFG
jgi:hypothetical protein